jgi:hypothetical protein
VSRKAWAPWAKLYLGADGCNYCNKIAPISIFGITCAIKFQNYPGHGAAPIGGLIAGRPPPSSKNLARRAAPAPPSAAPNSLSSATKSAAALRRYFAAQSAASYATHCSGVVQPNLDLIIHANSSAVAALGRPRRGFIATGWRARWMTQIGLPRQPTENSTVLPLQMSRASLRPRKKAQPRLPRASRRK